MKQRPLKKILKKVIDSNKVDLSPAEIHNLQELLKFTEVMNIHHTNQLKYMMAKQYLEGIDNVLQT